MVRAIHKFIISRLKFVEVGGHKMFLDHSDSHGLAINQVFEPFETELVKKEIKNQVYNVDLSNATIMAALQLGAVKMLDLYSGLQNRGRSLLNGKVHFY